MTTSRDLRAPRRIRVLRVITRLNIGGPSLQAALLTERLDRQRFESMLVAGVEGAHEGSIQELGRVPPDLRVVRLRTLGRAVSPLDDARSLLALIRVARGFRPDIVHTHMAKAGFVGRIAGRLAGARALVHTYHGSVFRGYFGRAESWTYLTIERALSRITTRLVAITPRQRTDLLELGIGNERSIVEIPLGLDLERFSTAPDQTEARRALGLPVGARVVLIVARLVPIKDVGTFLRALALLPNDTRGIVVGDGTERASLEALASELRLGQRCVFLGWRADLPTLYSAADVVVLSSLNEGSPVSLIEALATGSCVVATAVGGVPDVVRHDRTGLLVPPSDPAALAAAISRSLSDGPLRERLREEGRTAALARYDARRLVSDIEDLYVSLLT